MNVILRITDYDTSVIGLTRDEPVAEKIIEDDFRKEAATGVELVKITYEGRPLYTIRSKAEVVADEFEYVDNDGNPINEDGSDKVDNSAATNSPIFQYDGEVMWGIWAAEEDEKIEISSDGIANPLYDIDHIFEAYENIVITTN